jgi:hypothetical protein
MNRLIIDPISHGVIVTDGGNKKIWAIGSEGEKKALQYRPWRKNFNEIQFFIDQFRFSLAWSTGFLTNDVLVILHAGCLTFHPANHNKPMNNGIKIRNNVTNTEKV